MSLYEELSASSRELFNRADQFYAAANKFTERFRQAVAAKLGASVDLVQLRRRADDLPPVNWPPLTTLGPGDVNRGLYFTFAITTILNPGSGETAPAAAIVTFKPTHNGFEGFILRRSEDGSLGSNEADRFEIRDETGWDAAVERCIEAYRRTLSFDPFHAGAARSPIGFDLAPVER